MMGFKKNTPGGNAGCDACRVYRLGDCTCRRIRRSRRIRQWHGADAGCDACRVLSGQEDCTCRRIRRLRRIRQQLQIIAYGKNRYTTYTNARHSRRNLVRLAVRQSAGCNSPELGHRRLILWRDGRTYPPVSGHHRDNRNAPSLSDQTRTDPHTRPRQ